MASVMKSVMHTAGRCPHEEETSISQDPSPINLNACSSPPHCALFQGTSTLVLHRYAPRQGATTHDTRTRPLTSRNAKL